MYCDKTKKKKKTFAAAKACGKIIFHKISRGEDTLNIMPYVLYMYLYIYI